MSDRPDFGPRARADVLAMLPTLGASLATPGLLRGTVSARRWPGVVVGTGLTSAARQTNLVALQASLNYAATNRHFFEIEPGDYEIEGVAGLVIPVTKNTGFVWRGTKGSHIKQFANNCPVITIGEVTTSSMTEQAVVQGFRASYATTQAANVNSTAVRIGACRSCTFSEWNVFADYPALGFSAANGVKAYRGIRTQNATDPLSYFSNTMSDIMIGGCQQNHLDLAAGGTGSVFSNIYISQGITNNPQPVADYPLRLRGTGDLYESVFEQINIEWCSALYIVFAEIVRNTTFLSWHLEGNSLVGADPAVINMSSAQLNLISFNLLDLGVLSANATGAPSILRTYGDCAMSSMGMALNWSSAGRVNRAFQLVNKTSFTPVNSAMSINMTSTVTRDVTGDNFGFFGLDGNLPAATFPTPAETDMYRFDENLPEVVGPTLKVNANTTIYGCYSRPTVIYPAVLGAARLVVLATTMKAAGALATVPVPTGALATVKRASDATAADANALTVRNATTTGTVLSTISTAPATAYYRFNGTAWVVVT